MKLLLTTLKKFLFWSYERGSWQYDVMCVVILAFIFFAPNSVFHNRQSADANAMTKAEHRHKRGDRANRTL